MTKTKEILLGIALLSSSTYIFANTTYQLCSGNQSYQDCQTFDNKAQCVDKLEQCQNAPNQIKPWLCGSCHAVEMVGGKGGLPPDYRRGSFCYLNPDLENAKTL